jgi:peptide deformylase
MFQLLKESSQNVGTVDRYACIEVDFQDLTGNKQKRICSGIEAFVIQHEIDHLDGILFIDKVNGELEDYTKDIKFA